jgi:hypothetical protein
MNTDFCLGNMRNLNVDEIPVETFQAHMLIH